MKRFVFFGMLFFILISIPLFSQTTQGSVLIYTINGSDCSSEYATVASVRKSGITKEFIFIPYRSDSNAGDEFSLDYYDSIEYYTRWTGELFLGARSSNASGPYYCTVYKEIFLPYTEWTINTSIDDGQVREFFIRLKN